MSMSGTDVHTFAHARPEDIRSAANPLPVAVVRQETKTARRNVTQNPAIEAMARRSDLQVFSKDKAVLLFSLELVFDVSDSSSIAATALTDHSNDKSCDLVFVDRGAQRIVVAQGTWTTVTNKLAAPASKAADLNQGLSWLIAGDLGTLPQVLQSAAIEVRDALENDDIRELHVWMCHNMPESTNVDQELQQAACTADSLIRRHFPDAKVDRITSKEIGDSSLQQLYERSRNPILVPDKFDIQVDGGYQASGEGWTAFCTYVTGTWLRDIWKEHGTDLLSPNVRDYLGVRRTARNINNGIKRTAQSDPSRFWIYNNGLTVLVNSFQLDHQQHPKTVAIHGVGIINGAQTTGALGTLTEKEAAALENVKVMARFVACSDNDALGDIIRYNNTQNKVEASDFRSTDTVQVRLREEFDKVPNAEYRGGRRGGARDAISRTPHLLADTTVAQSLAAFHGHPNLAYNETAKIWEDDATYSSLFHDDTTAAHIVLTYSLVKAVESVKQRLASTAINERTTAQKRHIEFLSRRGAIALLSHAVSAGLELIVEKAINNTWRVRFNRIVAPGEGAAAWEPIVHTVLSFSQQLAPATDNGLKNSQTVSQAIDAYLGLLESTVDSNRPKYQRFAALIDAN